MRQVIMTVWAASLLIGLQSVRADIITFNLVPTPSSIDEVTSGSLTVGGITATFSANVGELNGSTDDFGVNSLLGSADEPAQIDGDEELEAISITFDQSIFFTQLTLDSFATNAIDTATLSIAGNINALSPLAAATDVYNFTSGNRVSVGEEVVLSWVSGNGFSFEGFQVRPVPEPSSLVVLGLGAAGVGVARRIRRSRAKAGAAPA